MPRRKKTVITGYGLFVQDQRDEYERKGWHFPRNNQDAFAFVAPLWKKLSDEERQFYNDMAKEEKRKASNDLENKFNSLGVSLADVENHRRDEEEYTDIMNNTIINSIKETDFETSFKTKKFYLCHVNYFYINSVEIFKPAEIALSEFNLKSGLLARFHAFINPGCIETGYRFEAKRRLEETHRIPIEDPNWTCAEKDYVKLFNQIKNFLCKDNPNGRIPPIYTMQDDEKNNFSLSAVRSTIETLCEACDEDASEFRIYPLPLLYHEMRRKAMLDSTTNRVSPEQTNLMTISMSLHDLERDKFCYSKGIACEFHEERDIMNFCSLSIVTRLVYTMCDYLLNFLGESLVPGGHAPKNSLIVKEVIKKDDDFKMVPLRKPNFSQEKIDPKPSTSRAHHSQARSPDWLKPSTSKAYQGQARYSEREQPSTSKGFSSQSDSGFSYAKATGSNSSAPPLSEYDPLPSILKFQSPRKTQQTKDDYDSDDDSSIYEDTSVNTPNLSQNTMLSGYAASGSLSQSSVASEIPVEAMRFLGRGRGGVRFQPSNSPINWASITAGRGARIKSTLPPK